MTTFNPEQQQAIDVLGSNVIVSASAGAGKTTVLVARLMKRILTDGIRINEIVAMTFTEAAASEMKIRLLESLNAKKLETPSAFLQEQIALVETAQISTIHSFCLTIIKNYGYVLGINPKRAQNILDDAQVSLLRREAFDKIIRQWIIEKPTETKRILNLFSSNPLNFSGLNEAVLKITHWLQGKKNKEEAIHNVLELYRCNHFNELPSDIKELYIHKYRTELSEIKNLLQEFVNVSDSSFEYDGKDAKFEEQTKCVLQASYKVQCIIEDLDRGLVESLDTILETLNLQIKGSKSYPTYSDIEKKLTKKLESFISNFIPTNLSLSFNKSLYQDISCLLSFTQDFLDQYSVIKDERGCFDFNDFESYALGILQANNYEIAKLIQPLYKEIMVDEFQDTNEYQDEIIRLISNGSNIFRVGDIKQSIYKFRGAKPTIMKNLIDNGDAFNLFLSFNYRSKEDIVSYNNYVFDKLMNLTLGMKYTEYDHVNTGIPQQKENSYPVEFHIIESDSEEDDAYEDSEEEAINDGDVIEHTKNEQQAKHIAQEIIRFHKEGKRFKDMVVLVRSHTAKSYLKRAFEEANIPHFIDDRAGFYNSEIIQDVYQILNFANNPHDYYLVKVLLSTFVGYSVDEVATLRLHNSQSMKSALLDLNPTLYEALMSMIQSWKSKDIVSIIQDIACFNNTYHERMSLQDKTNFDFLIEKATQYQNTSIPTLSGFVSFIKSFENETSSEASSLSSEEDVVTSMTIHKSKGLQFPVVFLWGMARQRVKDHYNILVTDDELGLGLNYVKEPIRITQSNLLREVIEYKQVHEELEETLRLLYVALTRPQQHLIIVDAVKKFNDVKVSYDLLFNHSRQSELLYAASPKDRTILKQINSYEIGTEKLPELETNYGSLFKETFTYTLVPKIRVSNPELNITKYSKEGMLFGTTLHEAIENLPHRKWNEEDFKNYSNVIKEKLVAYNQHLMTQEFYSFDEIYHETSFMTLDGEGIIDFYALKDNRMVLVDFKSDNASIDELVERYKSQIIDYQTVLMNQYPNHKLETYIYSFKHNQYIKL